MSIVKSFSFPCGELRGDTFYIQHNSNNFTVIDCYLKDGNDASCRKEEIINEIVEKSSDRICRFISTHPDNDHILGIEELDKKWSITNFYAVENNIPADKNDPSLSKYIELKKTKNFPINKGIKRAWLNQTNDDNGSSGLEFLWPIVTNEKFKGELQNVTKGESPNNICCILTYKVENGAKFMWMGDLETDMQQEYYDTCKDEIPQIDILFQPHHGRKSGALPDDLLKALSPKLIIIGNAPSEHIDYGDSQMTITQNTAGDIVFVNEENEVHIYTTNEISNKPICLYSKKGKENIEDEDGNVIYYYTGTLVV